MNKGNFQGFIIYSIQIWYLDKNAYIVMNEYSNNKKTESHHLLCFSEEFLVIIFVPLKKFLRFRVLCDGAGAGWSLTLKLLGQGCIPTGIRSKLLQRQYTVLMCS